MWTRIFILLRICFFIADIRSKELVKARMEVLAALIEKKAAVVVTSIDAFMDCLLPREVIRERVISIGAEDTVDLEELSQKLAWVGYEREAEISGPGQFAVRGGILDVYPLTEELPIRIELWGMKWIPFVPLMWIHSGRLKT